VSLALCEENTMLKVIRQSGEVEVNFGDQSLEIEDAGDDYVLASCELGQLEVMVAEPWPQELTIQIDSVDGFGTYFFHELNLVGSGDSIILKFICHTPNKFWEGHYGLSVFIQSLLDQAEVAENFKISNVELEDDWKGITLERMLSSGDPIVASIQMAVENIKALMHQAEIALGGLAWKTIYKTDENMFCREILEPLLRRMNFLFVRYTHGRREYGKDFTFSENTTFGGFRHYGLQAKAGNVSGKVKSQVDELIGQVEDAFSMPFFELGSADRRYISTFVIAISGHFTENAREKIVEKIPGTLLGSIWFLDQTRIEDLICRYWQKK